jgi:hypothetical protein
VKISTIERRKRIRHQSNNPVSALQVRRAFDQMFGFDMVRPIHYHEMADLVVAVFSTWYEGYEFIREQSNNPNDKW